MRLNLLIGIFATGFLSQSAFAIKGDLLWKFFGDSVLTVEGISDLSASANGGQDVIVGSGYDTLYLVEGRGVNAGAPLWSTALMATLHATQAMPDISGDGRPDVVAGDESGMIAMISGGSGHVFWKYSTAVEGTVLSITHIPDINGDGKEEVVFGSENDTVYCLSGAIAGMSENDVTPKIGQVLWKFSTFNAKGGRPKIAVGKPTTIASGANSVSLIKQNATAYGIAVGSSGADSLFMLLPNGSGTRWKKQLPGDVWKVLAYPDMDNDGIEEVLTANGADSAYLFSGATGNLLWSLPVTQGVTSIAIAGDLNGDNKSEALVGDGGGKVYAVSGSARGKGVTALWTYDFKDGSTINTLTSVVFGNQPPFCAVGTSSNILAILSTIGQKSWSVDMGGSVNAITALAAPVDNGFPTVVAGNDMGYAAAYQAIDGNPIAIRPYQISLPSKKFHSQINTLGQVKKPSALSRRAAIGKYFSTSH